MKVVELKNLSRKNSELHYRKEFTGLAVLQPPGAVPMEKTVEFVYELTPTGDTEIRVKFLEDIDYPLLPVLRSLKAFIQTMDRQGLLP